MIRFQITDTVPITSGTLTYVERDLSFDTVPRPEGAISSLLVNDVEIMLNGKNQGALFVTGYCPFHGWKLSKLEAPSAPMGFLLPVLDHSLQPGVSVRLGFGADSTRWPMFGDPSTGWVRLGAGTGKSRAIRFAPGSVAVLDNRDVLIELWLHPNTLPSGFVEINAQ